ncbi:cytochrome P450 [Paxillus ammoniavirescens]|nr:cytochrome P450 [Paxillus ammoniavirescens]
MTASDQISLLVQTAPISPHTTTDSDEDATVLMYREGTIQLLQLCNNCRAAVRVQGQLAAWFAAGQIPPTALVMSLSRLPTLQCVVGVVAAASAVAVLYNKYQASPSTKNGIPLPPGPPACWFWENAFPTSNVARTLTGWMVDHGPIMSLRQGSQVIIIIGRVDAATEIMEKEGGALVDRPRSISFGEIVSGGMRMSVVGSGERFRRLRKAVHTHLQPKAAEAYQDLQRETARDILLDILNDPKHHVEHVQRRLDIDTGGTLRYAVSVILRVTYGKSTPTSNDDPEVVRIHEDLRNLLAAMRPGAYLVDRIPLLKHVPGYGRVLKKSHQFELALFRDQLGRVRDDMSRNEAGPSFGRTLLENIHGHRLSDDEMAYLAGSLFAAGSETTAVGLMALVLAAACHPEAQARVQEEMDTVVGKDRTPTFEDWNQLPQLHAFISETLRWRPIVPLGLPHRATKDIIWRGQCIPAGATVYGCHWAISRDPIAFPDPETFDPLRWLDSAGQLRTDMRFFTYGFGRRVCPGLHVANRSLYINFALLMWSFRIMERPDAPIDVNAFTDVAVSRPVPFEVEFVPRMEEQKLREMMEAI